MLGSLLERLLQLLAVQRPTQNALEMACFWTSPQGRLARSPDILATSAVADPLNAADCGTSHETSAGRRAVRMTRRACIRYIPLPRRPSSDIASPLRREVTLVLWSGCTAPIHGQKFTGAANNPHDWRHAGPSLACRTLPSSGRGSKSGARTSQPSVRIHLAS